jgi:hypothetical protein
MVDRSICPVSLCRGDRIWNLLGRLSADLAKERIMVPFAPEYRKFPVFSLEFRLTPPSSGESGENLTPWRRTASNGRICPLPAVRNTLPIGSVGWGPDRRRLHACRRSILRGELREGGAGWIRAARSGCARLRRHAHLAPRSRRGFRPASGCGHARRCLHGEGRGGIDPPRARHCGLPDANPAGGAAGHGVACQAEPSAARKSVRAA